MEPEKIGDLKKLDVLLDQCVNLLGDAIPLTEALDAEAKIAAFKQISAAIGAILYTKTFIPEEVRDESLDGEEPVPDGPLTPEQEERVSQLKFEEIQMIDDALMRNAATQWRKAARVVGSAMMQERDRIQNVPDIYYAQRIRRLVGEGLLESEGNLDFMRFSEVRLPEV